MQKNILLILTAIFITSCASSEKLLQEGHYNKSIEKAVKKLSHNPNDSKEINVLKKAFKLANQNDHNAIIQLKHINTPQVWPEIYQHYKNLNNRQNKIERLPNSVLAKMRFAPQNYIFQMTNARKKAAEYYHNSAIQLLDSGNKYNARKAYNLLLKEKQLIPQTPGLDQLINRAWTMGTTFVLFEVQDKSSTVLPKNFEQEILQINLNNLDSQWLEFDNYPVKNRNYQYQILLTLNQIHVSPEVINTEVFTEKKRVQDGWKYELDKKGNVKKDSLGNDIKIKNFKWIRCRVKQINMHKEASVDGIISIYNISSGRFIKSQPLGSLFIFNYNYAIARGNLNALSPKTRELVARGPAPFPSNLQMIYDNAKILKQKAKYFINQNRYLFK